MQRRTLSRLMLAAAGALAFGSASAQGYPTKPVTIVVPFAAGGPTDKVARDLAEAIRGPLGQQVLVENVGGAGGTLGATRVAKASPDGYTLLLFHIGMSTTPGLYRQIQYKPLEDFEFLGMVNDVPMTLLGRPGLPAKTYAELVEWLKANEAKANLANAGLGSASHLCGLMFMSATNLKLTTVPYKGTAPAMTDLLGGQVDVLCDQTTNTTPQIEAGRVQAYAVTSSQRVNTPALKDLPTLQEVGLKDFNVNIWHGMYAPKGTPKDVLEKVNTALRAALKDPEFIKRQAALGAVVVTDDRINPAQHRAFVAAEIEKWGAVIRAAGQFAD